MTPEVLSIIGVGIVLAGIILNGQRNARADSRALHSEIERRFGGVEDRMTAIEGRMTAIEGRIAALEQRMTALEQLMTALEQRITVVEQRITVVEQRITVLDRGQAKLEGLLEGLREAITGRRAAAGDD